MQASDVGIVGETLALRAVRALPGRASRTYVGNRVCSAAGCTTVLSRYNASKLCWQHEPAHPFVLRIERKDKRRF